MNKVDINTQGYRPRVWFDAFRVFILHVLESLEIENWEVSVLLCDNASIRELNRTYRGKDEATDVLSFAQAEGEEEIDYSDLEEYATITAGDIVISMEYLKKQSSEFGVSEENELKRLLIHGVLHLTGMDHETTEIEREDMLQQQEQMMHQFAGERIF